MTIKGYKREDLELMSKKDITNLILENRVRPMSTADLFNKIITVHAKTMHVLYIL